MKENLKDIYDFSDSKHCLPFLYDYAMKKHPETILELGVHMGYSTRVLLIAVQQYGGTVYSVDVSAGPTVQNTIKIINAMKLESNWKLIISDSRNVKWDRDIHMLYIDSSHKHGVTLAELEKYSPFVTQEGRIFMHDVANPLYLGVMGAINEFIEKNPVWEYRVLTEKTHGLGVLYRKV